MAPLKKCLKCCRRNLRSWRSGPDGPGTLCGSCGRKYYHLKLPVYRDRDGHISIVNTPGAETRSVTGFAYYKKGRHKGRQDLSRPFTVPFRRLDKFSQRKERSQWWTSSGTPYEWGNSNLLDQRNELFFKTAKASKIQKMMTLAGDSHSTSKTQQNGIDFSSQDMGMLHSAQVIISADKWRDGNSSGNSGALLSVKIAMWEGQTITKGRFTISPGASHATLKTRVNELFIPLRDFDLWYKDDQGDSIVISSENEMEEMINFIQRSGLSLVVMDLILH